MNPNPPIQWCAALVEPVRQSDYLFEWGDNGMVVDGPMTSGVPIPRAPGNRAPQHPHHFPGLSSMALHMEDHNSIPNQSAGNSLGPYWDNNTIMTVPSNNENSSLSPAGPNSPSLWAQTMDLDLDIKMEPLDDLLGVDDLLPGHPLGLNSTDDNNLLDDVNLDDLLIPEQFPNSGMDQPNSPLTLMTVHPDEVMGVKQGYSTPTSSGFMNQQTITQPVKAESSSLYSLLASSFPPQGGGWRDPLLTSSSLPGQQGNNQLGSIEECPNSGQQQNMSQQQHCQPAESTSALQELLLRSPTPLSPHSVHSVASPQGVPSPQEPHMGQSVPRPTSLTAANPLLSARLSSSAPSRNFSFEQAWQRREPRQHLLSTGSLAEEYGGSASSLSTVGGILSPAAHDLSIDEGIDSEDESDNEHYDSESDNDSIVSEDTGSVSGSLSKRERFFWQYNVQAKGPKGHRVTINQQEKDPHNLPSVMDPVFSPLCSIQGIKHSGKARRGDGNDLTPNPRKLVSIGRELDKLNKTINDMTPVSELPFNVRPKSRKEKNKLASRACRLKKKAQHEANKIKLYGLEYEHKSMLTLVADARNALVKKVESGSSCGMNPMHLQGMPESPQHIQNSQNLEKLLKLKNKHKIAGHTTDFVNKVIENTQNGNSTGGLEDLTKTFSDTNLATSPSSSVTGGFSPH